MEVVRYNHEPKTPKTGKEAGFTLLELMIAGGIFAFGMAVLLGSIITIIQQGRIQDTRVAAADLQATILDLYRGEGQNIFGQSLPYTRNDDDTYTFDNLGNINITVRGVIPGDPVTYFAIPTENAFDTGTVADPFEMQVVVEIVDGIGQGTYLMSTFVTLSSKVLQ